MEKPDDKGFINITWPSKTIPHGGIFHTKVAEPTLAQQELLRVQREESMLSIAQRQKGAYILRQKVEKHEPETIDTPLVRPRTSRRRSLSAIRDSGALEMDQYYPIKKGEDREKLKDKLAYKMAYGSKEGLPPVQHAPRSRRQNKLPTKKEQWHDLVTQIRERADWLAEMEMLGHGGPHRDQVQDQIAQRLRALDELGVDSVCSSARSNKSGFSVIPSERSIQSKGSAQTTRSKLSNSSGKKIKPFRECGKQSAKEENVLAYEQLAPLKYSPRRRV